MFGAVFDLCSDDKTLSLIVIQALQHSTEFGFRGSIAIIRRCIEMIDPQLDCPPDSLLLLMGISADKQSRDNAGPEADFGYPKSSFTELTIFHVKNA